MVGYRCWFALLLLNITIVFQTTSTPFEHTFDVIAARNRSNYSLKVTRQNILQYYQEIENSRSARNESHNRFKRYDVSTFRGHPKTREERWHANFNANGTKMEFEQTQSLVVLLNKIVDKYLNACIPIIFYDKSVEQSETMVLQMFFQVNTSFSPGTQFVGIFFN